MATMEANGSDCEVAITQANANFHVEQSLDVFGLCCLSFELKPCQEAYRLLESTILVSDEEAPKNTFHSLDEHLSYYACRIALKGWWCPRSSDAS